METLLEIKRMIDEYRQKWIKINRWTDPTAADSLLFLWTELYELRNTSLKTEYRLEAFDALMMALISLEKLNFTLSQVDVDSYKDTADKWHYINELYFGTIEGYLRRKSYTRNNEKSFIETSLSVLCFLLLNEIGDTPISTSSKKLDMMDKKRIK
jgi:hypothetical protein